MNDYKAMARQMEAENRANRRVMNTTIWKACEIVGADPNTARPSEVFHKLFNMYVEQELQRL